MNKITAAALSVVLATGAAACADRSPSAPDVISVKPPAGMVVSNPRASSGGASSISARSSLGILAVTLAYVSAVPGTFPNATSAEVRNQSRGGAPQSVQVIDGGFDPVGIGAVAGNELSLTVSMNGGASSSLVLKVPPRRPPEVVRTNPSKGRTDVAPNAEIVIVFSEPIERSTVTASTVTLRQDGTTFTGNVRVSIDGLSAAFIPDSPLRPQSAYALSISQGIRDADGDDLTAQTTVDFATESLPPTTAQLLFTNLSDRNVYEINMDGTGLLRLTNGGSGDYGAKWSPDSRRIAFAKHTRGPSNRGWGTGDIYVMNADGSNLVRRTVDAFFWSTDWSPDGLKLLVSDEEVYDAHIYVMSADDDGAAPALLVSDGRTPEWSPNGQQIAYVHTSGDDGYHQVYVMNPDGTGVRPLTEIDPGGIFGVTWSPDGKRIAFSKCLSGSCGIYVMDADGSRISKVADVVYPGDLAWSPDGAWIAFSMNEYFGREWSPSVAYIPARGGAPRVIVAGGWNPSWRP